MGDRRMKLSAFVTGSEEPSVFMICSKAEGLMEASKILSAVFHEGMEVAPSRWTITEALRF